MALKITSDSTCDLSEELIERYGISVVPLTVTLGDRSGYDGADISPEMIYDYANRTKELPKTSSINTSDYEKEFQFWHDQGFEVIHFCISSDISSCYRNACIAADKVTGVTVIDSRNLSGGQGLLVLHAAESAQNGASAEEVVHECQELIPKVNTSFILENTEYLRKGGRCSGLSSRGADILHIRVCIQVTDGRMKPGKKYRGKLSKAVKSYTEDRLNDCVNIDPERIFVAHTQCDQKLVEEMKELVKLRCPEVKEILETTAGATVTSHCGPGTLAIMFLQKEVAK